MTNGRIKLVMSNVRTYILAAIILGAVGGAALGFYFGQPRKGEGRTWTGMISWGTVIRELHIEVSPVAYPVAGQSWTIFVYSTNITSQGLFLTPLPNAEVTVSVKDKDQSKFYNRLTDANGRADFQYMPSYTDVRFQAFDGEHQSQVIVISRNYVSSNVIETLLLANGLLSFAVGLGTGLARRSKKIRMMLSLLFVADIAIFALVSFLSFYSRLFLETPWGYPEVVIENLISISILQYATILGVILLLVLALSTIVVNMREPLESKNSTAQPAHH